MTDSDSAAVLISTRQEFNNYSARLHRSINGKVEARIRHVTAAAQSIIPRLDTRRPPRIHQITAPPVGGPARGAGENLQWAINGDTATP